MKAARTIAGVVSLAGIAVVGIVVTGLILRGQYETEQSATLTFTLDENFTAVRKILVRNNSAKQLVVMGGSSEFLDQKWDDVGGDVESLRLLDPKWRLDLHGTLRVRTRDEYVGQQTIDLEQNVVIEPDFLHSEVELKKPAERLRDYRMTTHFERDDAAGTTRVTLELSQRILTDAPWFAHAIADRRVLASAQRTLANQETAIRKLIAEHIGDVPLLPLR